MNQSTKKWLWIGGAVAAVGGLVAAIVYEEKKAAAGQMLVVTPAATGKIFNLKVGQQFQIQVPYDPTGQGQIQYNGPTDTEINGTGVLKLVKPDFFSGNIATSYLQAVGPGSYTATVQVMTGGQQTGTIQWTFVVTA